MDEDEKVIISMKQLVFIVAKSFAISFCVLCGSFGVLSLSDKTPIWW